MGRRSMTPGELEAEAKKPYEFTHNERFRGWWVWRCTGCGMVRLEEDKQGFET